MNSLFFHIAFCLSVLLLASSAIAGEDESDAALLAEEKEPTAAMSDATAKAMIEVIRQETGSHDRQKAAMALGLARINTPEAIQALRSMLDDPYPPARASALYALGRSRATAASQAVAGALADPEEMVRIEACLAAGEAKFSYLAGQLPIADQSPRVRLAAWQALANLDPKQAAILAKQRFGAEEVPQVRAEIIRCLRRGGDVAGIDTVRLALKDADVETLTEALTWLATYGRGLSLIGDIEEIKQHLAGRSALVLRAAVRAYSAIAGAGSEAALLALLADKERAIDPTVRVTIATALGEVGGDRCRPALALLQDDEVREVRRAASVALVQHLRRGAATKEEIETLALQAVRSGKPLRRREGLWMLGEIPSAVGFPEILDLALASYPQVGEKEAVPKFPHDRIAETCLVLRATFTNRHAPAADLAIACFRQTTAPVVRVHAARTLGAIKHQPALPILCAAVLETKAEMGVVFFVLTGAPRAAALWAIAEIGGDEAWRTFARLCSMTKPADDLQNVRMMCDRLVAIKYAAAAAHFEKALAELQKTEHGALLAAAVEALTGRRPDFRPPQPEAPADAFFLQVRQKCSSP